MHAALRGHASLPCKPLLGWWGTAPRLNGAVCPAYTSPCRPFGASVAHATSRWMPVPLPPQTNADASLYRYIATGFFPCAKRTLSRVFYAEVAVAKGGSPKVKNIGRHRIV